MEPAQDLDVRILLRGHLLDRERHHLRPVRGHQDRHARRGRHRCDRARLRARPGSHTPSGGDARVAAARWSGAPAAAGQRGPRRAQPSIAATRSGPRSPATSSGTDVATSGAPAPARSTIRRAVVTASSDVDEQSTARCSRAAAMSRRRLRSVSSAWTAIRSRRVVAAHPREVNPIGRAHAVGARPTIGVRRRCRGSTTAAGLLAITSSGPAATSICTMSGAVRVAIANGSRASGGVTPSTAMARTPTGTRSSGAIWRTRRRSVSSARARRVNARARARKGLRGRSKSGSRGRSSKGSRCWARRLVSILRRAARARRRPRARSRFRSLRYRQPRGLPGDDPLP